MLKRLIDIVGSLFLLVFLFPLMFVIGLLIFFKLDRSILFRQIRGGLNGQPFYIYKFVTMNSAKNEQGNLLPDQARLVPLGVWLRKYSLDELPQLWNILKGEMSLVGPRPLVFEYVPLYNAHQVKRLNIKPGLTGWAQINGRNSLTWEQKFDLDVWYVEHASLWLDIKILLLTWVKLFKTADVNHANEATMYAFKGSAE